MSNRKPCDTREQWLFFLEDIQTSIFISSESGIWDVEYLAAFFFRWEVEAFLLEVKLSWRDGDDGSFSLKLL